MYSHRTFIVFLFALVFLPNFIQVIGYRGQLSSARWSFGPSQIVSGDEPHYLVALNSLIQDGDLDLANNYQNVHSGLNDAGVSFASHKIAHHVTYYLNGKCHYWYDIYDYESPSWKRSLQGRLYPPAHPHSVSVDPDAPEYGSHPPGLALFLAPILYIFKGSPLLESFVLICSACAVFGTGLMLLKLQRQWGGQAHWIELTTLFAILGTPLWHYSRALFVEPFLAFFLTTTFTWVSMKKTKYEWGVASISGLLCGIGVLMKPPFFLAFVPVYGVLFLEKKYMKLAAFALFPFLSWVCLAFLNWKMFGHPLRMAQTFELGNPLEGAVGLLFSVDHGLLTYSPYLILSFVGWMVLFKEKKKWLNAALSSCALYFLVISLWPIWHGGFCYGPRLIVPIIPLLSVGMLRFFDSKWMKLPFVKGSTSVFCLISILINLLGTFYHPWFWSYHPFRMIFKL